MILDLTQDELDFIYATLYREKALVSLGRESTQKETTLLILDELIKKIKQHYAPLS